MNSSLRQQPERRQRLHELVLALIAREEELPLMDEEWPESSSAGAPARWLMLLNLAIWGHL